MLHKLVIIILGCAGLASCGNKTNLWDEFSELTVGEKVLSFDYCQFRYNLSVKNITKFDNKLEAVKSEPTADTSGENIAYWVRIRGAESAQNSSSAQACNDAFDKANVFYRKNHRELLEKQRRQRIKIFDLNDDIAVVQRTIFTLAEQDQAGRKIWGRMRRTNILTEAEKTWVGARAFYAVGIADDNSTKYMKSLLTHKYDWIDVKRFGEPTSGKAWLLVQHADDDPDFQALALERMAPYLQTGDGSKQDYAYLYDRIEIARGREQLYGTQTTGKCVDGKLQLRPIKDIENINNNRADMDMGTIAEYIDPFSERVCRAE